MFVRRNGMGRELEVEVEVDEVGDRFAYSL